MVVVNIPIKILGRPSSQQERPPMQPFVSHSRNSSSSSTPDGFVVTSSASTAPPDSVHVPVQRMRHSPAPAAPRAPSRTRTPEKEPEPERPAVIPLPPPETSTSSAPSPVPAAASAPTAVSSTANDQQQPEEEHVARKIQPQTRLTFASTDSVEDDFEQITLDETENGVPRLDGQTRRRRLKRNQSVVDFNAKTIVALDKIEQQVELLRKTAAQLEIEKEQILRALSEISLHNYMLRLAECDREEIAAITERLTKRTKTVQVVIETPRNEEQKRALDNVNQMIDELSAQLSSNIENAKTMLQMYLNACSSEETSGATSSSFLRVIIECAADDQKRVKRRLENLLAQVENAEKTTATLLDDE